MEKEILDFASKKLGEGKNVALVFLTDTKGSTPGRANSMMAVLEDGKSFGTIGGGPVEYLVIKETVDALKEGKDRSFEKFLTEDKDTKMLCGGHVEGFIKVLPAIPRLYIFGAGHVSQKLSRIASRTNFDVVVIDKRVEYAENPDFDLIKEFIPLNPEEAVEKIGDGFENSYVILATTNNDVEVLKSVLRQNYKFLGMLGSRHKKASIDEKLRKLNFTDEEIGRINTPVGLDIDDGSVEEIAISIMGEILKEKNRD